MIILNTKQQTPHKYHKKRKEKVHVYRGDLYQNVDKLVETSLISVAGYNIYLVVQFYPWFTFFPLFQTHYHTLPYPKTTKNKIYPKNKTEPQHL